jgi:starch-binding outer membrane protein, SusD/RagB family
VVDRGPALPHTEHFERAEEWFTEGIQVARAAGRRDLELAAIAGRAAARVWQGNWQGAVSDAGAVPNDFVFQFRYLASLDWADYNRLYFRVANEPWRRYSVWNTFYEGYYTETGDPRTPWTVNPDFPIGNDGQGTPFYIQQKFTRLDSPINVASGREMRLLEAESLLRDGDWEGAMVIINGLRTVLVSDHTGESLEAWAATNIEEAWSRLKRERGIELWLEGRRLPDLRRWLGEGTPGEAPDMTGRSLCFPIGETEHNTNPNTLPWDAPRG